VRSLRQLIELAINLAQVSLQDFQNTLGLLNVVAKPSLVVVFLSKFFLLFHD
jgi:hypothetical protein